MFIRQYLYQFKVSIFNLSKLAFRFTYKIKQRLKRFADLTLHRKNNIKKILCELPKQFSSDDYLTLYMKKINLWPKLFEKYSEI